MEAEHPSGHLGREPDVCPEPVRQATPAPRCRALNVADGDVAIDTLELPPRTDDVRVGLWTVTSRRRTGWPASSR